MKKKAKHSQEEAGELSDAEVLKLSALCDDLVDGTISPVRHLELERILISDEAAQRHYVRLIGLSASLHEYAGEFGSEEGDGSMASFPDRGERKRWPLRARLSLAAALVSTLFLGTLLAKNWMDQRSVAVGQDDGIAVMTRALGLEWVDQARSYRVGQRIPAGRVRIASGTMQIEFYGGATVILEGPANFEIRSANAAFCHYGKLRGNVPPQAIGFTIGTPEYDLVDLGTEFGIAVAQDGTSEVHIFNGKVELRGVGREGKDVLGLSQGQAMRLTGAMTGKIFGMNPGLFPGASLLDDVGSASDESSFQKWKKFSADLKKDPSLVAYFTFEPERPWDRVLRNQGQGSDPGLNGAIVGAKWAEGRWPGKGALDFKSPADRVRLSLTGDFRSLSFAAWVRIDGLDRKWNSLLLTDDWKAGSVHWQFGKSGEMILGTRGKTSFTNYFSGPEIDFADLGRWMFLATVYDSEKGEVRHWIDQKVISREAIQNPENFPPIKFGSMELGNYRPTGKTGPQDVRNFNGRMDEFMLFSRALTDEDLETIFQIGRQDGCVPKQK